MTRGEEFSFSSQSCDTFLSTASLSSYAFWMGYLMPQDRPIYYIPMITPVDTRQILPKRWIQLNNL
uniref:Uncharacterized protein n=1 Tax=Meloidogyne hapla TaxID=6305 RepID=A0A1I8BY10_MELHA